MTKILTTDLPGYLGVYGQLKDLSVVTQEQTVIWGSQSQWFVDPQNITGKASNLNVGDSSSNPLLTIRELAFRISSPTIINQNTNISILSDCNDDDSFFWDIIYNGSVGFPSGVNITGATTTVDSLVLTGNVNQNTGTNTYAQITVAGYDWTPHIGKRIRREGTQIVSWIVDVPGSVDTAIIRRPWNISGFSASNYAVGQTIVIEDLTQIGVVGGRSRTRNWTDFVVNFYNIDMGLASSYINLSLTGCYGCNIDSGWLSIPDLTYIYGSRLKSSTKNFDCPGTLELYGSWIDGELIVRGGGVLLINGDCLATKLIINDSGFLRVFNSLGFYNWTSEALRLRTGTNMEAVNALWGQSAVANTFGIRVDSVAAGAYQSLPNIIGALSPGQDVLVGGVSLSYAALPNINTNNNALLVQL